MSRVVMWFLAAILLSVVSAAQTPPIPGGFAQPPRDTSAQTGTAIIRGHVFDAANGQPLRKAQVRALSPELRDNRLATTDANGAYEFKDLAAGRYSLQASKGSYVGLSYGQTRPFEPGKPVEVRNAQLLDKVDFSLPRGAVITGRVVDEFGEPVADVQVAAMRSQSVQGRRQLMPAGRSASTNDIGEFRLFALPPGQYVISATYRTINIGLNEVSNDRSGYAPTYYPGTPNSAEAQRITIGVGQKLSDLNIALSPTKLARVSGSAVDSEGRPFANGILMMVQTSGDSLLNMSTGGQIRPDGTWVIGNVAPGNYTLRAMPMSGLGPNPSTELVQADISVAGEDINDVRLVGVKPSKVTGRVIPAASQANNTNFTSLQLIVTPVVPQLLGGGGPGRVSEDGTFEMNVPPGRANIRMSPTGPFANTRIRAVRLNGVDVTDSGIDFRPNEDVTGLEIELTTQLSSVSGVVSDARGNTVKDYTIVAFARDREKWGAGSRYLNGGRPDQDGKYKVFLPPGDYYVVALDYIEQGTQTDPEFLERLKERASEFSINEGEAKTLDLKLVSGF
jgi:protocatechuate 3,4-dioxygenase beta subunit